VLSRRYIDRALEHTKGNKTRAADLSASTGGR